MASYSCSICGAPLQAAQTRCHQCGSEIDWDQAVGRVQYVGRLPRRSRFRSRLLPGFVILAVLTLVGLAGWWGLRQELERRGATFEEVVAARLRLGFADLRQGDMPAAGEEFGKLTMLEPARSPLPTPAPPPTVTATPVEATPVDDAIEQDLADIQADMDAGQWDEAIRRLRALNVQDPGAQAGLIGQMLFNAQYNHALALIELGDLAAAGKAVDEALSLRPGNVQATTLKQSIDLYMNGVSHMGGDWAAAIDAFTDLYAHDPDFQDTPKQLFLAYAGYGDSVRYSDPCQAVERYRLALQLQSHPQVQAKMVDAKRRCDEEQLAERPAQTPQAQIGGPTPGVTSGRIAYTYFDSVQTYHVTRFWDIHAGMPSVEIARESLQPDVRADSQVVVRSTNAEHYGITLYEGPGLAPIRLTDQAGDSLPRWSPEGRRILFTSTSRSDDRKAHLFVLDITSGLVRDLGLGEGGDWSPDGRNVVYRRCQTEDDACGLWILDLVKDSRRQLTTVSGDAMPTWSPDGRRIAFMSNGRSPSWDVFVMDAQTGAIPFFILEDAIDGLPVWSPDGNTLAFLSDREGDWAVYAWSLQDLSINRLFPVEGSLPSWPDAGLSWEP